jgi:Skp family chaperone for outer membrane proteins
MTNSRIALLVSLGCLVTALTVLSLPTGTIAQSAGGSNVAVCDLGELINEYEYSKDMVDTLTTAKNELTAEMEARDAKIQAQQDVLLGLNQEYEGYDEQLKIYRTMVIEAQIWMETEEMALAKRNLNFRRTMYQNILDTVAEVARDEGYTLVVVRDSRDTSADNIQDLVSKMQNRKVLYNDDGIDITETVLSDLNLAYQRQR